jgi:hypothetical protein
VALDFSPFDPKTFSALSRDRRLSSGAFRLWHVLYSYTNCASAYVAYPGVRKLRKALGSNSETIAGWRGELVAAGWLRVIGNDDDNDEERRAIFSELGKRNARSLLYVLLGERASCQKAGTQRPTTHGAAPGGANVLAATVPESGNSGGQKAGTPTVPESGHRINLTESNQFNEINSGVTRPEIPGHLRTPREIDGMAEQLARSLASGWVSKPTVQEVEAFFDSLYHGCGKFAKAWHSKMEQQGWLDAKGRNVRDWKKLSSSYAITCLRNERLGISFVTNNGH